MNPPSMCGIPPWNIITARTRGPHAVERGQNRPDECARPRSRHPAWADPSSVSPADTAHWVTGAGTPHSQQKRPAPSGQAALATLCPPEARPDRWAPLRPPGPTSRPPPYLHVGAGPRVGGSGCARPTPGPSPASLEPLRARYWRWPRARWATRPDPRHLLQQFSAYWYAAWTTAATDNRDEEWCADFAAGCGSRLGRPSSTSWSRYLTANSASFFTSGAPTRHLAPARLGLHPATGRTWPSTGSTRQRQRRSRGHTSARRPQRRRAEVINGADETGPGYSVVEVGDNPKLRPTRNKGRPAFRATCPPLRAGLRRKLVSPACTGGQGDRLFISRKPSRPSGRTARPTPDSLKPPNGVEKSIGHRRVQHVGPVRNLARHPQATVVGHGPHRSHSRSSSRWRSHALSSPS